MLAIKTEFSDFVCLNVEKFEKFCTNYLKLCEIKVANSKNLGKVGGFNRIAIACV